MDVAVGHRSQAVSGMELLQGMGTSVAVTVLAFARMTGADPLFQFVWRNRIGSGLLFGLLATASIVTLSLVIGARRTPRERVVRLVFHFATSAATLAIGSALLAHFFVNPSEAFRFLAAPIVFPFLLVIAVANTLLWRRTREIEPYICTKWPAELSLAIGAIGSAVVLHLATNAAELETFAIQNSLILLGAVTPLLCFLTAFMSLRHGKSLWSVTGLGSAAGSCAMIAILTLL